MNLVNELQVSAERDDVLTVLRKTKRLASKLGRQDLASWLQAEQGGYAPGQPVPDYRKVETSLAYNTNGYIPAGYGFVKDGVEPLPDHGLTAPAHVRDSISGVLSMIEAINGGQAIYWPLEEGTEYTNALRRCYRFNPMFARQITFMWRLSDTQIKAIPEQIKDKVLDWACALEAAGVTGDGLSFSAKEKEIAHSITFNIHDSHIEQLNNLGTNKKADR
jgi:hypothetical protein